MQIQENYRGIIMGTASNEEIIYGKNAVTEALNYFGYKSVYYTVSTAGAIVGGHVCQSVRSFKFRH